MSKTLRCPSTICNHHEWPYTGKKEDWEYTNCPRCMGKINIGRCRVKKRFEPKYG